MSVCSLSLFLYLSISINIVNSSLPSRGEKGALPPEFSIQAYSSRERIPMGIPDVNALIPLI